MFFLNYTKMDIFFCLSKKKFQIAADYFVECEIERHCFCFLWWQLINDYLCVIEKH